MEEQQFKKAFNEGYILAKHAPTLMESLKVTVDQNNDYLNGILSGAKQYELDKAVEHDINLIDKHFFEKNEKDHDLDIEKDHD